MYAPWAPKGSRLEESGGGGWDIRELLGILNDRVIGSRDNEDGAKLCFERSYLEAVREKIWARGKPSKKEAFVAIQERLEQSLNEGDIKG